MNLVDEKHVTRFEIRHQRGNVARFFQHRATGRPQLNTHFLCNNARQGCLAKTGRTKNQSVVQRLTAPTGGSEKNLHLFTNNALADIVRQPPRSDRAIHGFIAPVRGAGGDQPISFNYHVAPSI